MKALILSIATLVLGASLTVATADSSKQVAIEAQPAVALACERVNFKGRDIHACGASLTRLQKKMTA